MCERLSNGGFGAKKYKPGSNVHHSVPDPIPDSVTRTAIPCSSDTSVVYVIYESTPSNAYLDTLNQILTLNTSMHMAMARYAGIDCFVTWQGREYKSKGWVWYLLLITIRLNHHRCAVIAMN